MKIRENLLSLLLWFFYIECLSIFSRMQLTQNGEQRRFLNSFILADSSARSEVGMLFHTYCL